MKQTIKYMTSVAGVADDEERLTYWVEDEAVRIGPVRKLAVRTQSFSIPPELMKAKGLDAEDLRSRFADAGVEFPQGTSLTYNWELGILVVTQEVKSLDDIEKVVEKIQERDEEQEKKVIEERDAILKKLDSIRLKSGGFNGVPATAALKSLFEQIHAADSDGVATRLNTVFLNDAYAHSQPMLLSVRDPVSLELKNVSAAEAIQAFIRAAGLQFYINRRGALVFIRRNKASEK